MATLTSGLCIQCGVLMCVRYNHSPKMHRLLSYRAYGIGRQMDGQTDLPQHCFICHMHAQSVTSHTLHPILAIACFTFRMLVHASKIGKIT